MELLKLDGMDRLRSSTEQAEILGIIKDKEMIGDTSRHNRSIIYFAIGAISALAVVALLYKIYKDKQDRKED